MKKMVIIFWVFCFAQRAGAQTWPEWFQQKQTKIKYLLEQIAALKAYSAAVEKGYSVVRHGLSEIALSKKSDLNQHKEHFASLLIVKQSVRRNEVIERILLQQKNVLFIYNKCKKELSKDIIFSSGEKAYFTTVLDHALTESHRIEHQVILVSSEGVYQMSDDERIKRLYSLLKEMEELYSGEAEFMRTLTLTALNRVRDEQTAKRLRTLY